MTAKEYLRQIGVLNAKINRKQKQVEELKLLATSNGSVTAGDRVQSSPSPDKMSDIVARWVDMEEEITKMIDRLVDMKHRIIGEIHQLDDERYIRILEMRYVDQETWEQIAVNMHYSMQHVIRIHGHALQEFTVRVMMSFNVNVSV